MDCIGIVNGLKVDYHEWLNTDKHIKNPELWRTNDLEYLGIGQIFSINGKLARPDNNYYHFWKKIK